MGVEWDLSPAFLLIEKERGAKHIVLKKQNHLYNDLEI